ncbi:hypothetical protein R1sor_025720 [Riccia sorocarpa]|uniref:Uncharacterized protein n=1 Tax=Riccia sorocarpa TaxID=122646 RepID=A0ABD3GC51_9MARC
MRARTRAREDTAITTREDIFLLSSDHSGSDGEVRTLSENTTIAAPGIRTPVERGNIDSAPARIRITPEEQGSIDEAPLAMRSGSPKGPAPRDHLETKERKRLSPGALLNVSGQAIAWE